MLKASELAFPNIRIADLYLISMEAYCQGRDPIYVHPTLYRALKLLYPQSSEESPGQTECWLNSVKAAWVMSLVT